ncbi:MAG: glycoside hydrolase family 5 protein [Bacteroidaceae bacterium]|nr:glycoside hydrolase family 5 protein [Candidatus Minthousia equi]MCQ2246364.1 glycoside hydrolase family 5 protein [Bacteroidaceae bacterium]
MKKIFKSFAWMLALGLLFTACNQNKKQAASTEEAATETAMDYAMSMGMGWNLGNSMDAHENGVANETCWHDQAATQATFDSVKVAGFKTVRIPTTWMGHIGDAPDYTIEKAWMDRVAEIVGYAKNAGLKVVLNVHHDGFGAATDPEVRKNHWLMLEEAANDSTVNEGIKAKLSAVWTQIANRFKDEDNYLMFETLNEIQDGKWGAGANLTDGGKQYDVLNQWNQVCVDAIRATGGKNETRYIGVPGYVCSPDLTIEHLVLPTDKTPDHLLVAVHSYDPWEYAGSGKFSEWGHTGKDIVEGTSEKTYTDMLDRLYDKYVKNGIPVYFGEFGCVHRKDARAEEFRKYYLEYVCKAMRDHKMTGIFWDNGYDLEGDDAFGLINHGNGQYIANGKEIVKIMVDAWENNDPEYTLEKVFEKAPK